jgi:hypothetical protein
MMVSEDKKQTNPAPKNEAPPEKKSTSGADPSKAEEGSKIAAALPSGYSRGEEKKPVSKAYKDNWDASFAKKKSDRPAPDAAASERVVRPERTSMASLNE